MHLLPNFYLPVGMIYPQLYCYMLLEKLREGASTPVFYTQNVFKVSHPINPIFVCFVEWSQGAQAGLLSDEIKPEDMFLDCN